MKTLVKSMLLCSFHLSQPHPAQRILYFFRFRLKSSASLTPPVERALTSQQYCTVLTGDLELRKSTEQQTSTIGEYNYYIVLSSFMCEVFGRNAIIAPFYTTSIVPKAMYQS